jgi:hypothetical protein
LLKSLFAFGFDYLLATVKSGGAYVVAQVGLTRGRLDRGRRAGQKIMCAVHAAFGWGLLVLLNCHDNYS